MTKLSQEYFQEAMRSLPSKQDFERLESLVRHTSLLSLNIADDVRIFAERVTDLEDAVEWNSTLVDSLDEKGEVDPEVSKAFRTSFD